MRILRLLASLVAVSALVAAGDAALRAAIEKTPAWRHGTQDPRRRILWDARYDGSPVVIIGDSVLTSSYVDRPDQTLWARLSGRLGVPVFPAALDGATPADMVLVARRVASLWPPGTVALVGIHPARVFVPGSPGSPAPHFAAQLQRAEADPLAAALQSLLEQHLFLAREYDRVQECLQGRLWPEARYFRYRESRDRRWDADGFAKWRFDGMETMFRASGHRLTIGLDWVEALHRELADRGLRPVFVLTPLNQAALREYGREGDALPRVMAESRARLLDALGRRSFEYLDLQELLEPASFADLIHPNARGDDQVAEALSRALAGNAAILRASQHGV